MDFNWTDIERIGKKTFTDVPKDYEEFRSWSNALFLMNVSAQHIIRSGYFTIEEHADLFAGIYDTIKDSMTELIKAGQLFPRFKVEELLDFIYSFMVEVVGYVEISKRGP